jgi:phenylpropionate dioxygenase-like ring-hydroxylating dioxygenase large terminal subunit
MYINFWYPICTSEELQAAEPVPAQIMGLQFVAFRDTEGAAHVLANTCVHRGGSLAKGSVKDGCIVCPYHGWRYGGDGKCQLLPSFDDGTKIPARAKVDSYPVKEQYGIVFAFLGDLPEEERLPLYEIEEFEDEAWRKHDLILLDINCFYERSMENGVDFVHNEFVHPIQASPKPIPGTVKYPETQWGSGVTSKMTEMGSKPRGDEAMESDPNVLNAGTWHYGPNTLITWITFGEKRSLHQYIFEAPVDGDHTKIFFINLRSFMLEPEHDEYIRNANLRVTVEDIDVLEGLYPVRTPETRTREILTPSDKPVVRYREFLDDWNAKGWRLDTKALQENRGDVAYAIPCPARRNSGNWVLDPVPLKPAARRSGAKVESAA